MTRVIGPVTLRPDGGADGRWWALNKRETGWASFGYVFDFLGDALDEFELEVASFGVDRHGLYITAKPRGEDDRLRRCLLDVP